MFVSNHTEHYIWQMHPCFAAEEDEASPASELRQLIKQHLSEELNKLKQDMELQLSETDKAITEKLHVAEAAAGNTSNKTGRASGRSKKK